jgi:hypothetical protein
VHFFGEKNLNVIKMHGTTIKINNSNNIIIIIIIIIYNSKQYRSESTVISVYEYFAIIQRAKSTAILYFIFR